KQVLHAAVNGIVRHLVCRRIRPLDSGRRGELGNAVHTGKSVRIRYDLSEFAAERLMACDVPFRGRDRPIARLVVSARLSYCRRDAPPDHHLAFYAMSSGRVPVGAPLR